MNVKLSQQIAPNGIKFYNSNPNLKGSNVSFVFTKEQIEERIKCTNDPIYFIQNYMKIVHVDKGLVPFELYEFQKTLLKSYIDNRFTIAKLPRQVGKCVHVNTKVSIRHKKTYAVTLEIGKLYEIVKDVKFEELFDLRKTACEEYEKQLLLSGMQKPVDRNGLSQVSEKIETDRKFIDTINLNDDFEILTDSGWRALTHIHKTIEYDEWTITTEFGKTLIAADTHILFDENFNEIYLKDCIENETHIQTKTGPDKVVAVKKTANSSNMFDVTVDSDEHRFYTNDILSHNSTVTIAYILWVVLFGPMQNIAILANKASTARDILAKLQLAYEHIPLWMQQGINSWNKGSIELENGSKVIAAATASSSARGSTYNCVFLDEFAFVPKNIAEDFMTSVYPTISSGTTTKVIMVSTPNGMNLFYKYWTDAINGRNLYKPIEAHWSVVPGRDSAWAEDQIKQLGQEKFDQEFNTNFLGSSNTLIAPSKLGTMAWIQPIRKLNDLSIYEEPKHGHIYVISVDTAEGQNLDYSAFTVIDCTSMPYKLVAKYKNNKIAPMLFPSVIYNVAQAYNTAHVLAETNGIGTQIVDLLHKDLEFENIFSTTNMGRGGQRISAGFKKNSKLGVKMTNQIKSIGCANLKAMLESDKLIIEDFDIISELTSFVASYGSFSAESGCNDDLVMTLVLFSWLSTQQPFKELTDTNIRQRLAEETMQSMQEEIMPFGFIDDGTEQFETFSDSQGNVWEEIKLESDMSQHNPFSNFWKKY